MTEHPLDHPPAKDADTPSRGGGAMTPARAMAITLAIVFILGLVWLLIQVRSIVLLLVVGILLAAAIEPLVNRLRRHGLTRGQGILLIYAGIVAILAITTYFIVPRLVVQGAAFIENIPSILDTLQRRALGTRNDFVRTLALQGVMKARQLYSEYQTNPPIQATDALALVTSLIGALFATFSVLVVGFYWMTEKALIKRVSLSLFPIERRERAHYMWDEIEGKIGGWARGQLVLMLVIGVLSSIAYSPLVLDLQFWFMVGIFAGLTELIPFIGPFLGGGLAFIVALTDSWEKALIVVAFVTVLQQVEGAVLVPRVMRNAVGLTPLTVILAVLIGGTVAGPLGAILAIPVSGAVQVLVQDLIRTRGEAADTVSTTEAAAGGYKPLPERIAHRARGRPAAVNTPPPGQRRPPGRAARAGPHDGTASRPHAIDARPEMLPMTR